MAYNNSIISEVYNYYQTSFSPKISNRFDAHNKSELKDIYNSIVNQSKDDSVFLLGNVKDVEEYTIKMKESAMTFRQNMSSLAGSDVEQLFKKKSLYSSAPDLAKIEYLANDISDYNDIEECKLSINQIAQPQINSGHYLEPDDMDLPFGYYAFDVETSKSNYELQFFINENDTNYDIQKRLARLINDSAIGLNSYISTDENGKTSLNIASTSSSSSSIDHILFNISDEEASKDSEKEDSIVDYLGIRSVSQEACWAQYSVNGKEYSSPTNEIKINNRFLVTLLDSGNSEEEPITIGAKADKESLKDSINTIAGSYNNFIKTISEYLEKQPRTTLLVNSMKRMTNYYSESFNQLGLSQTESGTISVDKDKLSEAIDSDSSNESFESIKKFAKSAIRKAAQIQLNPMDYADKKIVAYKNPHKTYYANPYITSAYSGMLFNGYM